jgi:hypothetical protein
MKIAGDESSLFVAPTLLHRGIVVVGFGHDASRFVEQPTAVCQAADLVISLIGAVVGMAGAGQGITPTPVCVWLAPVKVLQRRR